MILQENPVAIMSQASIFGPALAECLKDGSTPVRLAAERCALHCFQLTKGSPFPKYHPLVAGPQLFYVHCGA